MHYGQETSYECVLKHLNIEIIYQINKMTNRNTGVAYIVSVGLMYVAIFQNDFNEIINRSKLVYGHQMWEQSCKL